MNPETTPAPEAPAVAVGQTLAVDQCPYRYYVVYQFQSHAAGMGSAEIGRLQPITSMADVREIVDWLKPRVPGCRWLALTHWTLFATPPEDKA